MSISRSWTTDSQEIAFHADPAKLALYRISPSAVAMHLQGAVRGMPGSVFQIPNQDGLNIWLQIKAEQRAYSAQLETYPIQTPDGPVPLAQLGTLDRQTAPNALGKFEFFVYRKKGIEPSQVPPNVRREIIQWVYDQPDETMFKVEAKPDFTYKPVKGSFGKTKCSLVFPALGID